MKQDIFIEGFFPLLLLEQGIVTGPGLPKHYNP